MGAHMMNAHGAGGNNVLPDGADTPICFIPSLRCNAYLSLSLSSMTSSYDDTAAFDDDRDFKLRDFQYSSADCEDPDDPPPECYYNGGCPDPCCPNPCFYDGVRCCGGA